MPNFLNFLQLFLNFSIFWERWRPADAYFNFYNELTFVQLFLTFYIFRESWRRADDFFNCYNEILTFLIFSDFYQLFHFLGKVAAVGWFFSTFTMKCSNVFTLFRIFLNFSIFSESWRRSDGFFQLLQ